MRALIGKAISTVSYMIQCGCIVHCTLEYFGGFVLCSGPSMQPTIYTDNVLFTEHWTPRFRKLAKGDIVIAKCPTNPHQHICKRVTGLPGDKVSTGMLSTQVVPVGHVWLEGDNKGNSVDSRMYGPVPQGLIRSRAVFRLWPLSELRILSD